VGMGLLFMNLETHCVFGAFALELDVSDYRYDTELSESDIYWYIGLFPRERILGENANLIVFRTLPCGSCPGSIIYFPVS